jgi:hypothetical protein
MKKLLLLVAVAVGISACGIRINDEDDDLKDGEEDEDRDRSDGRKNELVLITEGTYSVELTSTEVDCERLAGGQVMALRFLMPEGPADGGLAIDLRLVGELDAGDALTTDNSTIGRYFDFTLRTPAGDHFMMTSSGSRSKAPDYAAVTISKQTDYVTAGRIWIQNLPLVASADASLPSRTLSARGSFSCAVWD